VTGYHGMSKESMKWDRLHCAAMQWPVDAGLSKRGEPKGYRKEKVARTKASWNAILAFWMVNIETPKSMKQ